jgi:hypothetical protein
VIGFAESTARRDDQAPAAQITPAAATEAAKRIIGNNNKLFRRLSRVHQSSTPPINVSRETLMGLRRLS